MLQELYYTISREQILDILVWVFLIVCLIVLAVMLYWQNRQGRKLKSELEQLGKLQKHNIEYEFVLEAMRLSIWHLDVKTMSISFEQDFRQKGDQYFVNVDGMALNETVMVIDPRDAERVGQSMEDLCQGRVNYYHEIYRAPIAYTNKFYWEESYATVAERDVDGKPVRLVGTTMRIDDRKAMEEALVEARNRAEESDRLKSAFLANMSHEIRTPLNAIIGFTSVLPDVDNEEERRMLLNLVYENSQKLLHIVDDVVNISKVETGKLELVMSSFDLNNELTLLADSTEKNASQEVKVSTSFANESQMIITDHNCLVEILRHYLSNAIKFTEAGSIVLGYDKPSDDRHIRIWIKDTGKGIPENLQQRVFERFYKVDEFVPGAGLGLSICQTLAHSLGGKVGVKSVLGEGSTFWVEIPIQ